MPCQSLVIKLKEDSFQALSARVIARARAIRGGERACIVVADIPGRGKRHRWGARASSTVDRPPCRETASGILP